MSNVNEELIFLEGLFLKVGTVDGDEQLEKCLNLLLPQAIARLSNPNEQVRNKVVELLTHINKRLKSRSSVRVPLDTLLSLYLDPKSSAFVVNFTVIYIKLGFSRAPAAKRAELLPKIVSAAELRPPHRESLVYLAVGNLEDAKLPTAQVEAKTFLGLDKARQVSIIFLKTLHNILLFPYGLKAEDLDTPNELSKSCCEELASNLPQITKGDSLEQLKVTCLKLICSGVYTDKQIFSSLVVASADTRSSVFNFAESHLRKILGSICLDDREIISPLYSLYMGSSAKTPGASSNVPTAPDKIRGPACVRLRLKLLPHMSKSKLVIWPTAIQVLFDSLYGENTSSKLRYIALSFCQNMLKNMTNAQITQSGQVLLKSGLLQLLSSDWAEPSLLRNVFPCIGLLVSRSPSLATQDLLQSLFTALNQERDRDVGQSIRDCLVMMSVVYSSEDTWLEELIKDGLSSRSSLSRLTSLHYLATCLPKASVNRVYLLLEASNHNDEEVSSEAKKALYCDSSSVSTDKVDADSIPGFVELVSLVLDKNPHGKSKPSDSRLHCEILRYLRLCLAKASGCTVDSLEPVEHPCESSPKVASYLMSLDSSQAGLVAKYAEFVIAVVLADIRVEAVDALIELAGCHPALIIPMVRPHLDKFLAELSHSKEAVRRVCARVVGLVHDNNTQAVADLMATALCAGSNIEKCHGNLLASAYVYERAVKETNFQHPPLNLDAIVDGMKKDSSLIVGAWCTWLAVVSHSCILPLSEKEKDTIVESVFSIIFSTKHTSKIKDYACLALSNFCITDAKFPHRVKILQTFIDRANEVKDVELVLSAGECLVTCVLGPHSPEACDPWTRVQMSSDGYCPDSSVSGLVSSLLSLLPKTHPNSKQCCCFWLLSVVKRCGQEQKVKERLDDIQAAFMELLSDSSSLVQEASSKGLALVYQNGGGSVDRAKLVAKLVEQLTSGKRSVTQVSQDTKLFEEGQLGKSPTGGNISTYKELCSLASDLNQPDLVYKFMNLANHNALWNSKKGAAFGVGTLADLAGGEMNAYLPKILPKLYRYQYDPTPGIQQTMTSIWSALTSNMTNVLEKYGKEIYRDLVPSLTSGQYRVRQSSCKAMSDFIRSAPAQQVMMQDCADLLGEVWTQLLRVMDDVHEATRVAATLTTKTLGRMMVRQCEKSDASRNVVATTVLPILLDKGVTSTVSEVRNLSAETLCSLIKVGVGEKEVVRLVPALLSASQHLDYNSLSHLSTMVSGSETAQEAVDSARVSAIKSHFTVQTLSRCVEYVKEPMLAELTPVIVDNLKSNVGLGSRLATCHFLTLLCHTVPAQHIQPYIGKYLAALLTGLSDRNGAVRRQYAMTMGQLCKYAKESSIDRLLDKLKALYFDKQDEGVRQAVGFTVQAMLNHNQEAVRSRSQVLLPLAFYAKHLIKLKDGANDKSISLWEEICDDVGGGSGVATNCTAVANLLVECLTSSAWQSKAQAGRGIKTLVSKTGDSLSEKDVTMLVTALIDNLSGRWWEGKDSLLHALASLAKYQEGSGVWLDVLERECTRGQLCYRHQAVRALGDALASLNQRSIAHNKYPTLLNIANKILASKGGGSDGEDEEVEGSKDLKNDMMQSALEAVGKAFPRDIDTQERVVNEVVGLVDRLDSSTRQIQVTIMSTVVTSVDRLHPALLSDVHLELCLRTLSYALGIAKHTALRKETLNLILVLIQRLDAGSVFMKKLEQVFLSFKDELDQDISSEVRTRLADIKQSFGV